MKLDEHFRSFTPHRGAALIFVVFLCVAALQGPAKGQTGVAVHPEEGEDRLVRSFDFDPSRLTVIRAAGREYTSVSMQGCLMIAANAGEPTLPVRFVRILLPPGKVVETVKVTGSLEPVEESGKFAARPVLPYQGQAPFGSPIPDALTIDTAVYDSDALFPAANHSAELTGFCRGYGIFSLGLHPVKVMPRSGRLFCFSRLEVVLELKDGEGVNPFLRRGNEEDAAWVRRLACNPEAATAYERSPAPLGAGYPGGLCDPADTYDYVVITTRQNDLDRTTPLPSAPLTWSDLMAKHAATQGLRCTLVTVEDILATPVYGHLPAPWNDAQARIREFCRDAYLDWGTSYILIGADAEWIPARLLHYPYEGKIDSDIYWNHLDGTFNDDRDRQWGERGDTGFDPYSEMFIGRITSDTPEDTSNWLSKNIRYIDTIDRDTLDNAAFYGGDTRWPCEGDDFIDYSAIYGLDHWLGPDPEYNPYPSILGYQFGFETWNQLNPGAAFDTTTRWTAEPCNPGGWTGGNKILGTAGLRNAINNDAVTFLVGMAHANPDYSLEIPVAEWESDYHNRSPFLIHDYGCHCGDMDAVDDGVLHSMLLHSDSELAFACIYNTGYGWGNFYCTCSASSVQQKSFWDYFFDVGHNSGHTDNWQLGKGMAYARDLMAPTLNTGFWGSWRGIIEGCLLFGDPALTLKPPAVPALRIYFPDGLPEGQRKPGPAHTIRVRIMPTLENFVPGTGFLHYRFDPAGPFVAVPLSPLGGDLFEATLPNTRPGDEPEFFFVAEGDGGSTVRVPWNAPAATCSFEVYLIENHFEEGFESGSLNPMWQMETTGTGRVRVTPGHGPVGAFHATLDAAQSGPGCTASMTLTLDMRGLTEAMLYYLFKEFEDEQEPDDDVSISNDGTTWYEVAALNGSVDYERVEIDLAEAAARHGLVFDHTFRIRWRWYGYGAIPYEGFALDEIRIDVPNRSATLWAEAYAFSATAGCAIPIRLDAGSAHGGRGYILGAGFSGSRPGTTLPGGRLLPVTWDWLTSFVCTHPASTVFRNFHGTLDGQGAGTAELHVTGPMAALFVGKTLTAAYTLTAPFDFTSNPIAIAIVP